MAFCDDAYINLSPPTGSQRLNLIRSLKASEFALEPCLMDGCHIPGCLGNRLEKVLEPGAPAQFMLIGPHHKNSWRGIEGHNFIIMDKLINQVSGHMCSNVHTMHVLYTH
jgi:hypothetical protein